MSKKKPVRRLLAGLLAVVTLLATLPSTAQTVKAASTKKMYALEITTGAVGTDVSNIQSIVISYKSGKESKVYVQNMIDSEKKSVLRKSIDYVSSSALANAYTSSEDLEAWKNAYGNSYLAYDTQTFFFTPYDSIDSVDSVRIITANSGSWEIQGMRLIELQEDKPSFINISEGATKYVPSYEGKRIFEMAGTWSMQWSSGQVYTITTSKSGSDPYLESKDDSYKTNDSDTDEYYLQLNIADEYMAGLESLDLADKKATYSDILTAKFYYEDKYGDTRVAEIPVLSGLMSELLDLQGSNANSIKAIAQQGNSIVVMCDLPGFSKLITDTKKSNNGIQLTLGYDITSSQCYKNRGNSNVTASSIAKSAESMNDALSLTDVALYNSSKVSVAPSVSSGELTFDISGKSGDAIPDYYFTYKQDSGIEITYGQTQNFAMTDNTSSKATLPTRSIDVSNLYLVEIATDSMSDAAGSGDLSIKFAYTTYGTSAVSTTTDDGSTTGQPGTVIESDTYNVKDKVKEFYGYWSGTGSDPLDYAYYSGMSSGGTLRFLVSLANVDTFKSVTLTLDGGFQWQSKDVRISRVTGLKHRTISLNDTATVDYAGKSVSTNHTINREVTSVLLASSAQEVLIRSGSSTAIDFTDSKSVVEDPEVPDAWDSTTQEMSYKDACKSLGFDVTRVTYNVDVTVAGASASDATNGDSGSKNLFYFRLNFENGSSAYVLANQQLSSDGFRTGQTERFSISMNQSYGELVSVDIIPDDTSSSSDIYDKLNIDTIRVTKSGNNSISRSWEITSPGWVGIDYKEEGESTTTDKQTGRYEGEIVRNYTVDKESYNVKLLFDIATANYDAGVQQFSGTVQATLRYTNSSNESKSITFDMVKQMYSYMNITPPTSNSSNSYCTADTSTMFRGNTSNRFYLDLPDVQSVDSMTLRISDDNGTKWNIQSVGVKQVKSVGNLILTANNEYEYTGESEALTTQASGTTPAYSVTAAQGTQSDITINFQGNTIKIDTSGGPENATSTITRRPSGTNDTLNIFVKSKTVDGGSLDNYDVLTNFYYTNTYGVTYQNGTTGKLNHLDDYYYVLGINASSFSLLKQIKATATAHSGVTSPLYGNGIIVQHVRSGTLMGTYLVNDTDAELTQAQYFSSFSSITNQETQAVSLYFGSSTTKQALTDAGRNVAVSIGFKSSLGNDDTVYHSPYVYLTDEQYQTLSRNMMAEIDFHIPYVKTITDIRVAGIDNAEGVIESAVVGTYTNDASADLTKPASTASADAIDTYNESVKKAEQSRTLTGWYSFELNTAINNSAQTFTPTNTDTNSNGALVPATLTLTAEDTSMSSDMDLSVVVTYLTDNGSVMTKTIPSVKEWMDDSSTFTAGGSVVLPFMLSDVSTITGIRVQAIGSGSTYPLSKAVIEYNRYGTINTVSKAVNKQIDTLGYDISMLNGSFNVSATSHPADGTAGLTLSSTGSQELNFALTQGDTLTVNSTYSTNVANDYVTYALYSKESSGAISVVNGAVTVNGQSYTISTSGLAAGDYELHILSQTTKAEAVVKFTVKAVASSTDNAASNTTGGTDTTENNSTTNSSTTNNDNETQSTEGVESDSQTNEESMPTESQN